MILWAGCSHWRLQEPHAPVLELVLVTHPHLPPKTVHGGGSESPQLLEEQQEVSVGWRGSMAGEGCEEPQELLSLQSLLLQKVL